MKIISVLSGGMDSATALAWALSNGHDVACAVQFQYGSKHNERELEHARLIAAYYGVQLIVIPLQFVADHFKSDLLLTGDAVPEGHYADPSMKRTVVPFRNGIMLACAAGLAESAGAQAVLLGNHFGDHAVYPDCRASLVAPMAGAIRQGTYAQLELLAPFCDVDKREDVRIGEILRVPWDKTYSCYNGREKHCGKCGTCVERKEAFVLAGVHDPTAYEDA